MHRRITIFTAVAICLMMVVPGPASAQFFGPRFMGARFSPGVYNNLALNSLNNQLIGRQFYLNSYLNRAAGNVYAANAAFTGRLYGNALVTNAYLGNPNNPALNTLANTYANNLVQAQSYYTNAYLNRVAGNAFNYNAAAYNGVYNALTPNNNYYRYNYTYNPFNSTLTTSAAYSNPYGNFYRVNSSYYNPMANYAAYTYNPYAYATPASYAPYYTNPYATYYTPYAYYNPYAYAGSYVNPYVYSAAYPSATPYSIIANTSNPYVGY